MDYKEWEKWNKLMDSKLSPKLNKLLTVRTAKLKFYILTLKDLPEHYTVYTAGYVRGWMWAYDLERKVFKGGKLTQTEQSMRPSFCVKYGVTRTHVAHPELFVWYEVNGLKLPKLEILSSAINTFEYNGPRPNILREIPLDTFSLQLAELLH